MNVDKFSTKLNKISNHVYTIEEEIVITAGTYKGILEHDNANLKTVNVYTGKKLTGEKIENVLLSTPSETPWKTIIEVFANPDITNAYITYQTPGDTIEADDINFLQDSVVKTQEEFNTYEEKTDGEIVKLKNKSTLLEENKVDKVQGKQLSTNDYTNTEKSKLAGVEDNSNNYVHPNTHAATIIVTDSNNRFVSDSEKSTWNSKETPSGAQEKVDKALKNAKDYSDLKINDLIGGAGSAYDTLKELESAIKGHEIEYGDLLTVVGKKAEKVYVDGELAKKSNNHSHPYRPDTWLPPNDHFHPNISVLNGISASTVDSWNKKSTFDGNYNNLTNKPNIPSKISQLSNDVGFITANDLDTSQNHMHSNMSILNSISQDKINKWDSTNADTVDGIHANGFSRAYSASYNFGGNQNPVTTEQFISILKSLGAFSQPHWICRGSWSYATNQYINDTRCGNIHLAGCTVEVIGNSNQYTIKLHTATTTGISGTVTNGDFIYVNNGPNYNPGWRRLLSSTPSGAFTWSMLRGY